MKGKANLICPVTSPKCVRTASNACLVSAIMTLRAMQHSPEQQTHEVELLAADSDCDIGNEPGGVDSFLLLTSERNAGHAGSGAREFWLYFLRPHSSLLISAITIERIKRKETTWSLQIRGVLTIGLISIHRLDCEQQELVLNIFPVGDEGFKLWSWWSRVRE